jgi:hypothetical protein
MSRYLPWAPFQAPVCPACNQFILEVCGESYSADARWQMRCARCGPFGPAMDSRIEAMVAARPEMLKADEIARLLRAL